MSFNHIEIGRISWHWDNDLSELGLDASQVD
jgi:hypothetical protein